MTHLYTLRDALDARKADPFGQFGQGHDVSTWNGITGCGQTSVQAVIDIATGGRHPTHDEISKVIGYWRPPRMTGTSGPQLAKALQHWGLPYKAVQNLGFAELVKRMALGPVLFVVWYPKWPNWSQYAGRNRPRPWAEPLNRAGRNQFAGGLIEHWVTGFGRDAAHPGIRDLAVMEPNHNSPARPQKVAVDWVAVGDANAAYRESIRHVLNNLTAVVPTRRLSVA